MNKPVDSWVSYWNQPHAIYVNDRHADVHYRDIADAIVSWLPGPEARVLDYGCGAALHADKVAAAARKLFLCDAAETVRTALVKRFATVPKIEVIAPETLATLPDASLDLIIANSVVQYLARHDLDALLAQWRRLLAPGGLLVIGDVIPPEVGAASDARALLRYAKANGFLAAAVLGMLRTALSSYRHLRATLGFAQYTEAEFVNVLAAAGLVGERAPRNIEHNQARMTFSARPA